MPVGFLCTCSGARKVFPHLRVIRRQRRHPQIHSCPFHPLPVERSPKPTKRIERQLPTTLARSNAALANTTLVPLFQHPPCTATDGQHSPAHRISVRIFCVHSASPRLFFSSQLQSGVCDSAIATAPLASTKSPGSRTLAISPWLTHRRD
ncbi:hypothetical protein B0H67DRAFT_192390 [Lasiosphaeris hirsuta]|uniref:Uncharacterized protein n=1 Tax=Lasiosphaeris hirsuta TaxID=260670 RepID=A0AA40AR56_9PEZI|nr:hypothetical protein B0H67DRAFT_192390 [Lasiosphaeris hirsuta]